jgi:hypothetical protein
MVKSIFWRGAQCPPLGKLAAILRRARSGRISALAGSALEGRGERSAEAPYCASSSDSGIEWKSTIFQPSSRRRKRTVVGAETC